MGTFWDIFLTLIASWCLGRFCVRLRLKNLPLARSTVRATTALAIAGCLAACTITGSSDFRRSETLLEQAREQAVVTCSGASDCDQAWNRARLYIQLHSPTPISHMDATTIETGLPHTFGIAWFWVERGTAGNGVTTIRLKGMCRGMYDAEGDPGWIYSSCAEQIRQAELAFPKEVGNGQ
jgi:hypothetical protein